MSTYSGYGLGIRSEGNPQVPRGGTGTERVNIRREWFTNEMKIIAELGDTEIRHGEADKLMCHVLETLGYHEGVRIFNEMEKWYA